MIQPGHSALRNVRNLRFPISPKQSFIRHTKNERKPQRISFLVLSMKPLRVYPPILYHPTTVSSPIQSAIRPFGWLPSPKKHPRLIVCLFVPQETPNLPADIRNDDCRCNLRDEGRLTWLGEPLGSHWGIHISDSYVCRSNSTRIASPWVW